MPEVTICATVDWDIKGPVRMGKLLKDLQPKAIVLDYDRREIDGIFRRFVPEKFSDDPLGRAFGASFAASSYDLQACVDYIKNDSRLFFIPKFPDNKIEGYYPIFKSDYSDRQQRTLMLGEPANICKETVETVGLAGICNEFDKRYQQTECQLDITDPEALRLLGDERNRMIAAAVSYAAQQTTSVLCLTSPVRVNNQESNIQGYLDCGCEVVLLRDVS